MGVFLLACAIAAPSALAQPEVEATPPPEEVRLGGPIAAMIIGGVGLLGSGLSIGLYENCHDVGDPLITCDGSANPMAISMGLVGGLMGVVLLTGTIMLARRLDRRRPSPAVDVGLGAGIGVVRLRF